MRAKLARGPKRAQILIINFGNAANVQTENAPPRTLQNYQQLYLVRTRPRLKSSEPQERRRRGGVIEESNKPTYSVDDAQTRPHKFEVRSNENAVAQSTTEHECDKAAYFCRTLRNSGALVLASLVKRRCWAGLRCATFSKVRFDAAAT